MEGCWLELCFGLANNTKDEVVTVPCVLVEEESKIVLRGLALDGTLIPSTGKELLRHLNLQSWVQGRPLKPLKDKPTYWQRSLITAPPALSEGTRLLYSKYCEPSYRRKEVKLNDQLLRSARACDVVLKKINMRPSDAFSSSSDEKTSSFDRSSASSSHSDTSSSNCGDSSSTEECSKRKRSREPVSPFSSPESVTTILRLEKEYQARAEEHPDRQGFNCRGLRINCGECGTSLPDIHRACQTEGCSDPETYCLRCSTSPCPKCKQHSYGVVDCSLCPDTKNLHEYSKRAQHFCMESVEKVMAVAEMTRKCQQEHIDALPTGWEEDGFFRVTAEQFQEHMVLENAIRFGIPVLVTTLGTEFEEKHFKRKALRSLVEDQNKLSQGRTSDVGQTTLKMQISEVEETEANIDIGHFFASWRCDGKTSKADPTDEPHPRGYKIADLGSNPKLQAEALFRGCDRLGIGSFVRPDGQKNLCSYLEGEDRNLLNGTQVPDLGPKLYIARPRLVKTSKGDLEFEGDTFTRLHCDLADAVNYSYGEGEAIWTIFAAKDRQGLIAKLKETQHDLYFTSEPIFLSDDYLEASGLQYCQFRQKKGDLVVIPAGCAHQVENCSKLPTVKIAQDFVAPQSTERCREMLEEMREVKAVDKLQLPLTLRFAAAYLQKGLEDAQAKRRRTDSPVNNALTEPPVSDSNVPANMPSEASMLDLVESQPRSEPDGGPESHSSPGNDEIDFSGTAAPSTPQHQVIPSGHGRMDAWINSQVVDTMVQKLNEAKEDVRAKEETLKLAKLRRQETQAALEKAVQEDNKAQQAEAEAGKEVCEAREVELKKKTEASAAYKKTMADLTALKSTFNC